MGSELDSLVVARVCKRCFHSRLYNHEAMASTWQFWAKTIPRRASVGTQTQLLMALRFSTSRREQSTGVQLRDSRNLESRLPIQVDRFLHSVPNALDGSPDARPPASQTHRYVRYRTDRGRSVSNDSGRPFLKSRRNNVQALPSSFRRRCYGASVEAALAPIRSDRTAPPSAPRLQELMSQLDADGHNTAALREELSQLLNAVAIALPGFHTRLPPDLQMVPIAAHGERQLPDDLLAHSSK